MCGRAGSSAVLWPFLGRNYFTSWKCPLAKYLSTQSIWSSNLMFGGSLLTQGVSAMLADLKFAIFWHDIWPPKVAHTLSFYPRGSKLSFFKPKMGSKLSLLWVALSEVRADIQNCHIWAWNLDTGKSSRSCTYTVLSKLPSFAHYVPRLSR